VAERERHHDRERAAGALISLMFGTKYAGFEGTMRLWGAMFVLISSALPLETQADQRSGEGADQDRSDQADREVEQVGPAQVPVARHLLISSALPLETAILSAGHYRGYALMQCAGGALAVVSGRSLADFASPDRVLAVLVAGDDEIDPGRQHRVGPTATSREAGTGRPAAA
jgi:hypothetical protein